MQVFLYPFMLLSALGLLLSIGSHLAALAGLSIPGGRLVFGLQIGILVVWLPTILVANRMARHGKRSDFLKLTLSGCPKWARYALYGLFGYAILNFIFGMSAVTTLGNESNVSQFVPEIRLFSGHWMLFYGVAFATLYSAIHNVESFKGRKCTRGHEVSLLDKFCPECGAAIERERAEI